MSMAEYHVGCVAFEIYAGTLNQNKTMWRNKSNVTDEAVCAVAEYLLIQDTCVILNNRGKRYRLKLEEVEKNYDAG